MNRLNIYRLRQPYINLLVNHGEKVSIEKVLSRVGGKLQIYLLAIPGSGSSMFSFIPATFLREDMRLSQAGYEVRWLWVRNSG